MTKTEAQNIAREKGSKYMPPNQDMWQFAFATGYLMALGDLGAFKRHPLNSAA